MISTILSFLPLLGPAAVVVLAQTQVRERSDKAALALTVGGGLEAAYMLARHFVQHEALWLLGPLVQVAAVGAVCFGLLTLIDELSPKRGTALPPALATLEDGQANMPAHVILGVFGVLGVIAGGFQLSPGASIASVLAIVATLAGSIWVSRRGGLARWVMERRPDLVAWTYVHQLRVVNRQTGSSSTHWSAQVGLATGEKVALPALSEQAAQVLVASVMQLCPGVVAGFSAENAARFKSSPAAMRR